MAALAKAPFVTILPQGDDGWYIDSPQIKKDKFEQLLTETIAVAEKEYRLSKDRTRRGIAGWSMGGFGSAHYAVKHPQEFGFLATIIGLLDFPREGLPEGQTYKVPGERFGTDAKIWQELNPLTHAEQLRNTRVFVVAADQAFDRTMNENFHQRLQELEIDHGWKMLSGGHKIEVVHEAVPLVIQEFTSFLGIGKR